MKIAFIGTGVMGAPMAGHLCQQHQVTVFNRTIAKTKHILGPVTIKDNLLDAIENQDLILTMLGTPKDVEGVYKVLLTHVKKGTGLIDFTTSSPSLAKQLAQQAKSKGLSILDAPVTGGQQGAIQKTLTIMVGGEKQTFQTYISIFEALGKNILYMGEAGQGQHAKMVNQLAIAGQLVGLAEALTYAKHQQLNLESILTMLQSGAAQSYSVKNYGPKMIVQDWQATFYLKHFLKDLTIAIEHASIPLPVVIQVKKTLETLVGTYGEKGVQSTIQAYVK
jgi:3-hydroxyisobutyrate dehydrogenase-like beta-hydroxyacid dehydrogenase